ncbi:hypothetical protein EAI_10370 [Harpegnathos saltator]|uniref:Mitochondrial splicing suppressor 51-like C-terminal domain-containing protein n=1 Tax=Harpegnathos saltator TaxID=610380 RepID=E2B5R1_HARSA|nr:hypothetical protein EAI_10370 [Harpegnathos saltator]
MIHRPEHEELCNAMIHLSKQKKVRNDDALTLKAWVRFKKDNLAAIQQIILRDLLPYEKQMFLFAKSCFSYARYPRWTPHDYILTDDLSGPLTLFYAIKQARLLHQIRRSSDFVVHIIASKFMDRRNLLAWEILLHEFHQGTNLKLVIIGPELLSDCNILESCRVCVRQSRTFEYEVHRMLYHVYVQRVLREPPNVIVAFDIELKHKLSYEIIKTCQRQCCPVLLTAKSKAIADYNVMMIQEILNSSVDPIISETNKFKSLRPYKDYESDSIFYPNEYLVFYQDLTSVPNCSFQSSTN